MGEKIIPSCYAFNEDEENPIVGAAALEYKDFYHDIKRIIGKTYTDIKQNDVALSNSRLYEVAEGENKRCIIKKFNSDKTFQPEELSAIMLKELKKMVETKVGREVKDAVITVPAYFNNTQKQATKDAARIAGLKVLRLINEPTAAATACGFHKEVGGEAK